MEIGTAKPWQRKVLLWIFAHSIVESESREGRAAAVRWKWSSSYLRVTDADYQRALTKDSALQKALQQPAVLPRTGSQPEMGNPDKPADYKTLRESAARCEKAVSGSVVPTGFEPVTSRM
ncbi:MAG: hypothetical protein CMJ69_12205 [Planctomycetaceae bacterium]|nr:hypothetical protein [Planctomycetaceae bacterium]